jgi:hypothetical protein
MSDPPGICVLYDRLSACETISVLAGTSGAARAPAVGIRPSVLTGIAVPRSPVPATVANPDVVWLVVRIAHPGQGYFVPNVVEVEWQLFRVEKSRALTARAVHQACLFRVDAPGGAEEILHPWSYAIRVRWPVPKHGKHGRGPDVHPVGAV